MGINTINFKGGCTCQGILVVSSSNDFYSVYSYNNVQIMKFYATQISAKLLDQSLLVWNLKISYDKDEHDNSMLYIS